MLAGRPAFTGNTVVAILHATVYEQPPALTGSPAVAAVDRVIRRALAKKPAERPATAEAMADELRDVRTGDDDTPVMTHALTRLVVLPFRMLRADPETDFLAFSLAGRDHDVARPASARWSCGRAPRRRGSPTRRPTSRRSPRKPDVDRVVTGTLLRSGDELRAVAQLVEAPGGTVITSHTVQAPLGDLFQLQDDLARRIVEALALPLGGGLKSPAPDAPGNPRAYELYLRGNELARAYDGDQAGARSVRAQPRARPRLRAGLGAAGPGLRVIGKYMEPSPDSAQRAEEAFRRALELNPKLTIAHKFYANLEADTGQAEARIVRLLEEANRLRQRPGAVRRPRPRVPVLRPLRGLAGGARRSAPAGSEHRDQRRTDAAPEPATSSGSSLR